MATEKLGLPTITGNMTHDVPRDVNALATAVDEKAGVANGLATLGTDGKVPAIQLNVQAPADASTTVKGIVQLNDATNSTLTTQAATANAVKKAYDRADAAFTSANNGKTLVRNAIIGKGGTVADADGDGVPTFAELEAGVNGIQLGKKETSGTITSASSNISMTLAGGGNANVNYIPFDMTNLPFVPRMIEFRQTNKALEFPIVWYKDNYYVNGSAFGNSGYSYTAFRVPYTNGIVNIPVNNPSTIHEWIAYEE